MLFLYISIYSSLYFMFIIIIFNIFKSFQIMLRYFAVISIEIFKPCELLFLITINKACGIKNNIYTLKSVF